MSEHALLHFRRCIPIFQVLVDPHRQDILLLISKKGELSVTEIAEQSVLSRPAISHHLKLLKEQGLVTVEKRGTERFYSLSLEHSVDLLKQLIFYLERDCLMTDKQVIEKEDDTYETSE